MCSLWSGWRAYRSVRLKRCTARALIYPGWRATALKYFSRKCFGTAFFHADMHPGNILVSLNPAHSGAYIALDFGIVGALSDFDKNYLAQNFLAFFKRNYRRVARLHVESGWAPPD